MPTINTSELSGIALDWAVIKANQWENDYERFGFSLGDYDTLYSPSTDWAQGGPIIELEKIGVSCHFADWSQSWHWCGKIGGLIHHGPTPLIAAMRCYVANKFGNEIKIPSRLQ